MMGFAIGFVQICAITPGIKKINIKKKKRNNDKIVLLANSKLNSKDVLISVVQMNLKT